MANILLAAYGGGHAKLLVPVVKELMRRGHNAEVVGLTLGKSVFTDAGIKTHGLSSILVNTQRWPEIKACGIQLVNVSNVDSRVGYSDSIAYLGSGFLDLIEAHGAHLAESMYEEFGRKSFQPINTACDLIAHFNPDMVVTTSAPRMEKALVLAARKFDIPCLVVVDLFASNEVQWLRTPDFADRICVFHDRVKKLLVEQGRADSEIIVTGNPAFDRLLGVRKTPRWEGNQCHVLYLSQSESWNSVTASNSDPDQLPIDMMKRLLDGAQRGLFSAEVRFHPNQSEIVRKANPGLLDRSTDLKLEKCLVEADVVITACSTAGIEAQIIGLPVIQIGWSVLSGLVPFQELGSTVVCEDEESLFSAIHRATKMRQQDVSVYLGCATERVVAQAESLLS